MEFLMFSHSQSLDLRYAINPSCVAKLPEFFKHDGDQIGFNDKYFAVGSICLDTAAGLNWDRPINAMPDSEEWRALFYHGLALHNKTDMTVVTGLPHTSRMALQAAGRLDSIIPRGDIELTLAHDGKLMKRRKHILAAYVRSECEAHALAFRRYYGEPSLVISIGFGTVELGACDKSGRVIEGSLDSKTYGLHHCAKDLRDTLVGLQYERPQVKDTQFSFFDKILKDVYGDDPRFCLRSRNRKGVIEREELLPYCDKILVNYGERLIEQLESYFYRFDGQMPVTLTGGGTLYDILMDKLADYIESLKYEVRIADKEMSILSAALGYKIIAETIDPENGAGVDVGNSSSVTILPNDGVLN
jgi:hypothetical protein